MDGAPPRAALTPAALALALLILAAASVPFWADPGLVFIAGMILIQGLFAMSWNVLFGYAGLASFGHAGFFAIGAYAAGAMLRYQTGIPFLLILLIAGALGGAAAWLIGIFALRRLAGIFLAVLTVALAEMLRLLISYAKFLGAEDGLANIPRPRIGFGLFTLDLAPADAYYWFLLAACAVLAGLLWWLLHGRYGRLFEIIREDPLRATFLGVDITFYRIMAFMVSGCTASLAGALYAPWTSVVTLDEITWQQSLQPMLNTLLGGVGSFWGPLAGSAVFAAIDYATRTYAGLSEIIIGTTLILIILVAPSGLVGAWRRLRRLLGQRSETTY